MSFDFSSLRRVIILADESANWKIAGLYQLERICLALNRAVASVGQSDPVEVLVFWRSTVASKNKILPNSGSLSDLRLRTYVTEVVVAPPVTELILTTRLFVTHNALGFLCHVAPHVLAEAPQSNTPDHSWLTNFRACEQAFRSYSKGQRESEGWRYLTQSRDISSCERFLLRYNGKTQDGIVSRFVNRPLTRPLIRLLLRSPITPNMWTLVMVVFPIAGAYFLLRGSYSGFLLGMLCYQLFSLFDGCDGEIARAKYMESAVGKLLDTSCDTVGNLLLLICLGVGLSRQMDIATVWRQSYLIEGILAACLTAINEILLLRSSQSENTPDLLGGAVYGRHRALVEHSGILLLGERVTGWLVQLTKRDVAILGFLILSLIGAAQWILHLSLGFAIVSLLLTVKAMVRTSTDARL